MRAIYEIPVEITGNHQLKRFKRCFAVWPIRVRNKRVLFGNYYRLQVLELIRTGERVWVDTDELTLDPAGDRNRMLDAYIASGLGSWSEIATILADLL